MDNAPVGAVQIMITVIPIVGIVMGSIVAFFYLLWRHKQRMLMIEKGMTPGQSLDISSFTLLAGLVSLSVGLVLFIFYLIMEGISYNLLGGLVPLSVGVSLVVFNRMIRRRFDA